jgi:hypothetical protein
MESPRWCLTISEIHGDCVGDLLRKRLSTAEKRAMAMAMLSLTSAIALLNGVQQSRLIRQPRLDSVTEAQRTAVVRVPGFLDEEAIHRVDAAAVLRWLQPARASRTSIAGKAHLQVRGPPYSSTLDCQRFCRLCMMHSLQQHGRPIRRRGNSWTRSEATLPSDASNTTPSRPEAASLWQNITTGDLCSH